MAMSTKYFREKYGLTQKQLSDMFNIPLRTIQNWEHRECCPDYIIGMMYQIIILEEKNNKLKDESFDL